MEQGRVLNFLQTIGILAIIPSATLTLSAWAGFSKRLTIILVLISALGVLTLYINKHIVRYLGVIPVLILLELSFCANLLLFDRLLIFKDYINSSNVTGVIEIVHESKDFYPEINHLIQNAQNEIWFFGVEFHITTEIYKNEIIDKAENTEINFVIPDHTDSLLIDHISNAYNTSFESLKLDILKTESVINAINQEIGETRVNILYLNTIPSYAGFFFDPQDTTKYSFVVPYLVQDVSMFAPGYKVANVRTGMMWKYYQDMKKTSQIIVSNGFSSTTSNMGNASAN